MTKEAIRSLWLRLLRFYAQHIWEKASNPGWMPNPSISLTAEFFANPLCPPGALAAASASAPIVVSGEERSENSPVAAGEEAILPTDQEEAVLPTDLPAELSLSSLLRHAFSAFACTKQFAPSFLHCHFGSFCVFWHCTIRINTRFFVFFFVLFNVSFEYSCGW